MCFTSIYESFRKFLQDLSSRDEQIKKINKIKAKEQGERNKKLKQRMHAAELRRKQDEEQQMKRLQQLEQERQMVVELATKRKELEVSLQCIHKCKFSQLCRVQIR